MMSIQGLIMVVMLGVVYGDPSAKIIMETVDVKMEDNPFLGAWTMMIHPGGEIMSAKVPVKKELPADLMIKIEATLDGNELPDLEKTVCEGLKDETIIKDMILKGVPKNDFPRDCPILANSDFEVKGWEIPSHKLPPGVPDGPLHAVMTIYEEGKSPIMTATAKGRLEHEIPGLGR